MGISKQELHAEIAELEAELDRIGGDPTALRLVLKRVVAYLRLALGA